ncbi:hypothetical protein NL108_004293 [Boleophthalmus pectinirostris]|uniref:glutathione-specific gamma-glutamylcyclotransferase 1-like n=1 Tax=Boleophthalmus pectinirostris TaxID=150288 RepID=UPI000A1C5B09|nr:glutathione-specific gamma-glutamylcyclotransferase 1-like [Boleophthalmus pectinirostris]KAJ0062676.1 hypothetical protein NL108_004293 [Boleophthalmus pectinirostris]
MKLQDIIEEKSSLWIFGYGSLLWKPNFTYKSSTVGFIKGYKRRFWHGDDFYRGSKENPGRVVTLIEDEEACTWGVAFEVPGPQIEETLHYLNIREVVMGSYITEIVEFIPRERGQSNLFALVYIATPDNPRYLGPAPDIEIATQIASRKGTLGPNIEYLVHLANFMRLYCPGVEDHHLFTVEEHALNFVRRESENPPQMPVLVGAE